MDQYLYLEYTVLLDKRTLAQLGNLHLLLHIFKTQSRKRLSLPYHVLLYFGMIIVCLRTFKLGKRLVMVLREGSYTTWTWRRNYQQIATGFSSREHWVTKEDS